MAEATQMATVAEVCGLLRVGRRRVYSLIRQGRLRAIRFDGGGPYRIFASSVESFLGVKQKTSLTSADEQEARREQHAARVIFGLEA